MKLNMREALVTLDDPVTGMQLPDITLEWEPDRVPWI